jgi:hypothetical protein
MQLCCLTQDGLASELSLDQPDWFAGNQVEDKTLEQEREEARFEADDSYRSLSKQVADHMKKETEKLLKQNYEPEELEAMRETVESEENILAVLRAKRQDTTIKDLRADLARLKIKEITLKKSVDEGVTDDFSEEDLRQEKEELDRVVSDQAKINALLDKIQEDIVKEQRIETVEKMEQLNKIVRGDKVAYKHTSNATPAFIRDTMLKLDQLMTWQFVSTGGGESPLPWKVDKFSFKCIGFCNKLLDLVVSSAVRTNRVEFMEKAQDFIVSHSVTLNEREYFRSMRSADDQFTYIDVCAMTRETRIAKESDFPSTIQDIVCNRDHPMYNPFIDFVVHWWLGQSLLKKQIDQSIFLHEADVEFFCFNRVVLKHPVLACIGGRWGLVLGRNQDITGDSSWYFDRNMNVLWGSEAGNIFEVLYAWCEAMDKRGWELYNYTTGNTDFIYSSQIAKLYKGIIN